MVNKLYITRRLEERIIHLTNYFPAVVLIGPRQVGKTSLTHAIRNQVAGLSMYLDLERPTDLAALDHLERFAEQHLDYLLIFDEVQRRPGLFPELRSIIDRHRSPGRFLLLGSASLDLIRDASETLAGRIAIEELPGLTLDEITDHTDWNNHWLRGGFPDALLAPDNELSFLWRENLIKTYVERDLLQFGIRHAPELLRRLFTMLAHVTGQQLNVQQLSTSLGIDRRTLEHYLQLMEQTFLVRRLPAYHANVGKRLVKRPKIYVRDSGLIHALLHIQTQLALSRHPIYGASFESYVVEQLYALALPKRMELYYYRTNSGNEIDLVLVQGGTVAAVVEIKTSVQPKLSRGFYAAWTDLQQPPAYVVCPTEAAPFPLKEEITVVGLGDLEQIFATE